MFRLNARYPGFCKLLEWAENLDHNPTKQDIKETQWPYAREADEGLYDVLLTSTEPEPQMMIINMKTEDGLAAWRKLTGQY